MEPPRYHYRTFLVACTISCLWCSGGACAWPDDEDPQALAAVLTVSGSVNGSNAVDEGGEAVKGGHAGSLEVHVGIELHAGDGRDGDVCEPRYLESGTYFFHQVGGRDNVVGITIQGDVTIYCQSTFRARVAGDYSSGTPNVTIYAGDSLHSIDFTHLVCLEMSAPDSNTPMAAGRVVVCTGTVGKLDASVYLKGGSGVDGGQGGDGGFVQLFVLDGHLEALVDVSGGNGGYSVLEDAKGGDGGDGGSVGIRVDSDSSAWQAGVSFCGEGGNGGGVSWTVPNAANGGNGGRGGALAVDADSVIFRGLVANGGDGGQSALVGGGRGGDGGQGGAVWAEADFVSLDGLVALVGGNGANGGLGDDGGRGGQGGDGGPGGTIDFDGAQIRYPQLFIRLVGGDGGAGGNGGYGESKGGKGGAGADGGLGGQAGSIKGMDSVLHSLGVEPGMCVDAEPYPMWFLDSGALAVFSWNDGAAGAGGQGGQGGLGRDVGGDGGAGGNGGSGGSGGHGGKGDVGGNGGKGGDASGPDCCSGLGLCLLRNGIPGSGGFGGYGRPRGENGANGSLRPCDCSEGSVPIKPPIPDGSSASAQKADVIHITEVDARDPEKTVLHCAVERRGDGQVDEVVFLLDNGIIGSASHVAGGFSFILDQNRLHEGNNDIRLQVKDSGRSYEVVETATMWHEDEHAYEVVVAYILADGVGATASIGHDLYEWFDTVSYSIPTTASSKLVRPTRTFVTVSSTHESITGFYSWSESHWYEDSDGQLLADAPLRDTPGGPGIHARTIASKQGDYPNLWLAPDAGIVAKSKTESFIPLVDGKAIPPSGPLVNQEVDLEIAAGAETSFATGSNIAVLQDPAQRVREPE